MKHTMKRTLKRTLNHTLNHFKLLSVLCLSLLIVGSLLSGCGQRNTAPDPEFVQDQERCYADRSQIKDCRQSAGSGTGQIEV